MRLAREIEHHSITTFGEGSSCSSFEEERGESEDESAEWSFRETSPTNSSDEVDIGEETQ